MTSNKDISNSAQLRERITYLEQKVKRHEAQIKTDYDDVKVNLRPRNLVKNTFSYVAETPEIQKTLINTAIGFILGYASKKAAEILTEETLNKTVENFVQHHLNRLENHEPRNILSQGISMVRKFTPPTSPLYPFVRYK